MIDFAWSKIAPTNNQFIEYRQSHEVPGMPVRKTKVSMVLKLPCQKEILWENLGAKLRAQINKATSHKHYIKIGKENLINDFYRVFSRNMRDLGTPVYSKSLFLNMLEEIPRTRSHGLRLDISDQPVRSAMRRVETRHLLALPALQVDHVGAVEDRRGAPVPGNEKMLARRRHRRFEVL